MDFKKNAFFQKKTEKKLKIRYTSSMDYTIRRLELFKDLLYFQVNKGNNDLAEAELNGIHCPQDFSSETASAVEAAGLTGERLTRFCTQVNSKNLEPTAEQYLCQGEFCGYGIPSNTDGSIEVVLPEDMDTKGQQSLPAGTYGFVQSDYASDKNPIKAAEALWLEFLWEEWEPADNQVYLRELPHGNTTVFQLFRRIKT